jgi:protein TonB
LRAMNVGAWSDIAPREVIVMSTATRIPLVLPVAGAITVGLFVMMNGLIDVGEVRLEEAADVPAFELAPVPADTETEPRIEMEAPAPIDPPPPPPTFETDPSPVDPVGQTISYRPPAIGPADIETDGMLIRTETNPRPVVRIEPVYPARAITRGTEGQCTLVFDITTLGRTANIRASDCTSSVFEQASIRAIANWRYNPQIRDGQPTLYQGATTVLVFRMSS